MQDKFIHCTVCFAATIIVGMVMGLVSVTASIFSGAFFSLGLGLGKEMGDFFNKDSMWDWRDLIADLVGVVLGTALLLIYWKIGGEL